MIGTSFVGMLMVLIGVAAGAPADGAPAKEAAPSDDAVQATAPAERALDIPDDLRWEPWWREQGDCGPLSLFFLTRLQNEPVTLDSIKRLIRLDPEQGCSLKDLQMAAEQLDVATEVRFVDPGVLHDVPGPFILHGRWSIEKNRGHFYLILGYDAEKKKYATIDTTLAKLGWLPEDTVLRGYSGYVLLPKHPVGRKWDRWAGYSLLLVGVVGISLWSYGRLRRRPVC